SRTDVMITLYDGISITTKQGDQSELQRIAFSEQRVEMKGIGTELTRSEHEYRSDREMSVAMLQAVVDTTRAELAKVVQEGRELSLSGVERALAGPAWRPKGQFTPPSAARYELVGESRPSESTDEWAYRMALDARRIANNAKMLEDRINAFRVEIHKKFAIPFACILFVLLAAPLAVRFPRGGVGMVIAASLAIFGIYYMSLIGGESLGDRGTIAPFWGPWAPNLLFG